MGFSRAKKAPLRLARDRAHAKELAAGRGAPHKPVLLVWGTLKTLLERRRYCPREMYGPPASKGNRRLSVDSTRPILMARHPCCHYCHLRLLWWQR